MSKKNHLKGLNRQLKERNPIINTLMKDFNSDMDDDDMVIENAVYGMDDDDIDNIMGAFESSRGDEFENEDYLDFEDLMDDKDDDEPIDDGIDSDLGEDEDDEDDFDEDDEEAEDIDLEDVMEAASIFDSVDDHFNPESDLDDISLDLLDDDL